MATEVTEMGPISYLIVEFPGSKLTGEGLAALVDLVDRGLIRVIDLLFVERDADGDMHVVNIGDLDGDGTLDLAVFDGASSGILDDGDVVDATPVIEPGSAAAILLYENRWAAPFTEALRHSGAQLVAAGYIAHDDIEAALDATEA